MRIERAADDGVSYEDGDVVHGGEAKPLDLTLPSVRSRRIGRRILSPLLCDVSEVEIYTYDAAEPQAEQARIKDCDDAAHVGTIMSDVDQYVGYSYPRFLRRD